MPDRILYFAALCETKHDFISALYLHKYVAFVLKRERMFAGGRQVVVLSIGTVTSYHLLNIKLHFKVMLPQS